MTFDAGLAVEAVDAGLDALRKQRGDMSLQEIDTHLVAKLDITRASGWIAAEMFDRITDGNMKPKQAREFGQALVAYATALQHYEDRTPDPEAPAGQPEPGQQWDLYIDTGRPRRWPS